MSRARDRIYRILSGKRLGARGHVASRLRPIYRSRTVATYDGHRRTTRQRDWVRFSWQDILASAIGHHVGATAGPGWVYGGGWVKQL